MPYKDKEKQREAQRLWAQKKYEKSGKKGDISLQRRKQMVIDAKNVPCDRCRERHPYYVMDLHHINPEEKEGMIGYFIKSGNYQSLQEEIDKCICVCANCHRYIHHQQEEEDLTSNKKYTTI